MSMDYTIRCNNCMTVFKSDIGLMHIQNPDGDGTLGICPKCRTAEYLMDGQFNEKGQQDFEITGYTYNVPCKAGDFVYACRKTSTGFRVIFGMATEIYLSCYGGTKEPKIRIKGRGVYSASKVFLNERHAVDELERLITSAYVVQEANQMP